VFARPGLKLAEWPDKAAGVLPTPDLALHLSVPASADDGSDEPTPRQVRVDALTPTGLTLLHALGKAA
jgi:tRNA threonylcarbamoyladenosine biosynthesis protein TsaE